MPQLYGPSYYTYHYDFLFVDSYSVAKAHDAGCPCGGTGKTVVGDEKLLRFLWENGHSSPFEQCSATFEIQAPIMVFREWHRHRTQSYNEMSGRYTVMPDNHYIPERSRICKQSTTNKQGSTAETVSPEIAEEFLSRIIFEQNHIYETYLWAVWHGIAKEVARINTPVSRYSKMRATASLLNWYRFLSKRLPSSAQWEIRQYAGAILTMLLEKFPRSTALFNETRCVR